MYMYTHMHTHTHMHCQNLKSGNDADQYSSILFMLLSYCQKYPAAWGIDNFMVSLQIILDGDWAMLREPNHYIHKKSKCFLLSVYYTTEKIQRN
jgi:hypothetical protein